MERKEAIQGKEIYMLVHPIFLKQKGKSWKIIAMLRIWNCHELEIIMVIDAYCTAAATFTGCPV